MLIIRLLLALAPALAVKDFMFRKCDQNPFCKRNRHYADQAAGADFVSPYTLNMDTFQDAGAARTADAARTIQVEVTKDVNGVPVVLPLTIEVLADDTVHFLLDERGRETPGKSGAVKDAPLVENARFDPAPLMLDPAFRPASGAVEVKKTPSGFTVRFGAKRQNQLAVTAAPFSAVLYHNGDPQVELNGRSLLNFEQRREQGDGEDAQWAPWELRDGAWTDSHDGKTDTKTKGPEAVALDIDFPGYRHVYGIPEHADSLVLRNTKGAADGDHKDPYRLFNVDIFEYETHSPLPMYGSIPFMLAQKLGSSAGVLWLNAADTYVDVDKSHARTNTHWISENGKLSLYVFLGNRPSEVLNAYGRLTGMAALPQQFATAYHQCRWNYNSAEDVLDVNNQFDENEIPYDVIWLDVEYTVHKKYFTWNKDQFPDPEDMMRQLDEHRRKLVAIIDPHIKAEDKYYVYEGLTKQSLAVRNAKGEPFHGHCWPGESVWVDSLNPASWEYWRQLFEKGDELGGLAENLHIWNDMNEPSVFDGPETTGYKDLIHHGGWEHRDIHNYYGMTFVNATYNALIARYEGKQRPFILTRAYFPGTQRLAAMWTGDNQATWDYLKIATPMILTQGAAGFPFAGADVGGFFGNPDPELLTRWYQAGAFYPFFRAHAHIDSRRREPYLAAEPYKGAIVDAIRLRYQLLPTVYTAFWEASQTLAPIMRPLFYELPQDEHAYALDDTFFLGDSLLAHPVIDAGASEVAVYIPGDNVYYDYWTGAPLQGPTFKQVAVGIDTIPLYARGGKVHVRRDRPRRSAELMVNDPYTVVVAVGRDGKAHGRLYVDDGTSFDYQAGDYLVVDFEYADGVLRSTATHTGSGAYKDVLVERIVLLGHTGVAATTNDGRKLDVLPSAGGVTIRNPRVPVGADWSVSLEGAALFKQDA